MMVVSPRAKKDESRKYFSAHGKKCSRVISFEPSLRQAMNDAVCKTPDGGGGLKIALV